MKLIDKDALVAEIERYKHKADERLKIKGRSLAEERKDSALQNLCGNLLYFINTLDVKEVDLEKELRDFVVGDIDDYDMGLAKHFFELGMQVSNKSQKGENV